MKIYRNDSNNGSKNFYKLTVSFNKESLTINCINFLQLLKLKDYFLTEQKEDIQTIIYDTMGKTILYYSIFE